MYKIVNSFFCRSRIKSTASLMWAGLLFCLSLIFIFSCDSSGTNAPGPAGKGTFREIPGFSDFLDPPASFRAFPFYSVNDKLEPSELSRQVREFKRAGFGGFYLHSREGLLTGYLGNEWWMNIDTAVYEALQNGLHPCFYDEDKWPSGYAGGKIPLMNEEYRAMCLARIKPETPLPRGAKLLREAGSFKYIVYSAPLGNPVFNGTCYVDLFNPDMVNAFIAESYKPYIDRYKSLIPPGAFEIFTDEPHIHARYFDRNTPNEGILSWSPFVAEKFRTLWGYDVTDKINLLFEEKDNWREVRLHYYIAVARQFEESFSQQIGEYCGKMGATFTGHFLGEESLEKVRDRIGNAMLHYRHMQQPGIDNLGLTITGRLITAKSLSSVANQYDIPRRMCEIFGISGQNMNFEDRKWLTGWQGVLGINHMIPHLTLYSLKGIRKRDYPPTLSSHQPWWQYNKVLEDYTARISMAATTGRYCPQILVLNPLESEYIKASKEQGFSEGVHKLMEELQSCHYDYDLGDEQILSDIAKVSGKSILVGAMKYQAVILPDMTGLRTSTVRLLEKFIRNGGVVFSQGRFPGYIDGKNDTLRLQSLLKQCISLDPGRIFELISPIIKPNVQLTGADAGKVWTSVRTSREGSLIMLYNTSHTKPAEIGLKSELMRLNPAIWDPSAAKCFTPGQNTGDEIVLQLAPSSVVWVTSGNMGREAIVTGEYPVVPKTDTTIVLTNVWQGKRLSPNVITLDFASWSADGGRTFSPSEPVFGIFQRLSDKKYQGPLLLRFSFMVEKIPASASLVVEQPEMYENITFNSERISFDRAGYFIDPSFRSANVGSLLLKGENRIMLNLDFVPPVPESSVQKERYGTEIESIYLTGDFGVRGINGETMMTSQRNDSPDMVKKPVHWFRSFSVTEEKTEFSGDLTQEGYPFFAGTFRLTGSFEAEKNPDCRYFLSFPSLESVVTMVELNGKPADTLVWSPYETEITDLIANGKNSISITLVNSLRNMLGPHHHPRGELIRVGPDSFSGTGGFPEPSGDKFWYDQRNPGKDLKLWTDKYALIPFGLIKQPELRISRLK